MTKRMIVAILVLCGLAVFSAGVAVAQVLPSTVIVNIDKASLVWDANPAGDLVDKYTVECGGVSGDYSLLAYDILPDATGVIPIKAALKDFVTQWGTHFCVVTASNKYGTSGPSNEVEFDAGRPPTTRQNLRLESQ